MAYAAHAAYRAHCGPARAHTISDLGSLPDDNPGGHGCVSFFFALLPDRSPERVISSATQRL